MVSSMTRIHSRLEPRRELTEIVDEVTALAPDAFGVRAKLVEPRLGLAAQVLDLLLRELQLLCRLCARVRDDLLRLGARFRDVRVCLTLCSVRRGARVDDDVRSLGPRRGRELFGLSLR